MNKILLALAAACAAALGFSAFHRTAEQTRAVASSTEAEWRTGANRLVETQETVTALRAEVLGKKNRLRQTLRHPEISPELLQLLERDSSQGHPAAWAELRQLLGLGWDSSPDYILVSKRVLKDLDYPQLLSGIRASDTTCDLLSVSPGEQTGLRSALEHARQAQWLKVERGEPNGDIVAQYTVAPPDAVFEQSMSNTFSAEIVAVVGPERADLLLPRAWRELKSELTPAQPETMTIRRTVVDGEEDLICEMKRGDHVSTSPIRYGHYPSNWFLTLFPGGWKTLAQREGFELPAKFQK